MRQPYASNRRRACSRVLVLILALLALVTPAGSASAHARLTASSPVSGTALAAMPSELTLHFSEAIDPFFSSASLLDASGAAFALQPITAGADDASLVVRLVDASAPPGTYTLVWRVLSAVDGHVTTGTIAFSAGTGVAPSATGGAEARPAWWRVAIRWIELTGLSLLTGWFIFILAITRRNSSAAPGRSTLAAKITLIVLLPAHLLTGYDLGIVAAGASFWSPPPLSVYRDILADSTAGSSWLGSAICLALIALVLWSTILGRAGRAIGLAAGLAALYAVSATGHAAAVAPAWRSILLDWLHFASVSAWLGALAMLWLALRDTSAQADAAAWIARFSRLGLVLIGVIVVSGVLRAAAEVSGPRNLAQSDYGRALIAKHLLFVAVLVAAAVNQLVLVPKIRGLTVRGAPAAHVVASVRRFASIELVAAAGMMLAAAAMTELAPADAPLAIDVATKPVTFNERAPAGDLDVWLLARLEGASNDRFTITVGDAAGNPPSDLQKVIIQSSTQIDGAAIGDRFDAEALSGSPGTYVFPAIRLGLPGAWDLSITLRRAGVEDVSATIAVDTSGAGARAPRLAQDEWRWPRPTIPAWLFGFLAVAALIGGIAAVKMLRGIEPFAAGIILTMTALIVLGFSVQGYRQTTPATAGSELANPIAADPGSIQRGEDAYRSYCLECHAVDGRGINEANSEHEHAGTSLTDRRTQAQHDGDLYWSISNGVAGTEMPAFDAALTEPERWDLVNYLRELKTLPPVSTPEPDS